MCFDCLPQMPGDLQGSGGANLPRWLYLRVRPEVASALNSGRATPGSAALRQVADSLGLTLEHRNPEVDHPALQLWFRAALPYGADGQSLLQELERIEVIDRVTLSSPEGLPLDLLSGGWTITTPT